ncbi:chaperonin 10-like protein [Cyathus striatus]|nr:chaperonin 10-like protein [Cyathus striatus]
MTLMKALVTVPGNTAAVTEAPIPEPDVGEIRFKVRAVALNPVDAIYTANPCDQPGRIIGSDVAGDVDKVGSGVSDWKVGDRVAGFFQGATSTNYRPGGFSEYAVLEHDLAIHIPASVSYEEAASVPLCSLTAAQASAGIALFIRLQLPSPFPNVFLSKSSQSEPLGILIYSASTSVGQYCIELAKLVRTPSGKPLRIFATASPKNHKMLLDKGVEAVFDYKSDTWAEEVRNLCGGVTGAVDCVSEGDTVAQVSQAFAPGGGTIAAVRAPGTWLETGICSNVITFYSSVWWGLGYEVIHNDQSMPASPEWRAFTVAFFKFLSAGSPTNSGRFPIDPLHIRLMPGGLERIVPDGFPLLGYGNLGDRKDAPQDHPYKDKEWIKPISVEKLVYAVAG